MSNELIGRLKGHVETLRGVGSGVYSDDIQEAITEILQSQADLKAIVDNVPYFVISQYVPGVVQDRLTQLVLDAEEHRP